MADITNLVELAEHSVQRFADRPLFGERLDGKWEWQSFRGWQARVDAIRGVLDGLGIVRGDKVAIISRNSSVWAAAAYATYGLGAAFVPMYEAQRPSDWEFILRDCGASVVFVRTPQIAEAVRQMTPRLPALKYVLTIEDPLSLRELEARAHPVPAIHPDADDLAGLIYTSGTTGMPKGVMLTHRNITADVHGTLAGFPFRPDDRTVSFLPWAHVYGQTCELHILVAAGASTAFNTNPEHLLDDLASVKPTMLVAVPRIFNKLHAAVRAQIAHKPRVIRRVFERGLEASIAKKRGEHIGFVQRIMLFLAGFLFAAVRRKLGGHLRYAISGSATLSHDVAEFIDAIGIQVYEGYGLTETSPIVSFNRPGHRKFGSVGLPLEGVRIEIDETRGDVPGEGEIVIHGPVVMKGYHARPEENARALTADGGLRTGDLGRIDKDGFLVITGRLKEQYKLENGKYVMPSPLEEQLQLSPYISNVMLHGTGKPYNVAVVVVDVAQLRSWAAERGITLAAQLDNDPNVRALIAEELDRNSREFRGYERPRDFIVSIEPFTVENGLLTPTLKLKRRDVIARFGAA
ncbi:MAG TPA: long-chain fatty acid--CoA ligase, partial [Kofleriaceae bacterium]|nr:long-chain fatty acid--CoA ligase [Kofleriaceae bacterium]